MHGTASAERAPRFAYDARNKMGGMGLLRQVADGAAAAAFLDPQYRGILDHMRYGNEGLKRERRRAALPAMSERAIACFAEEIERALRPSGHLFLWADKFTIGGGLHHRCLARAAGLEVVDLIAWNKLRVGMGRRARCQTEFLVVAQRRPTTARCWTDHRIPDAWLEASDRSMHPHAKPYQLTERLIRAVTKRGDLVLDPCAGSYVVLEACLASGRRFAGCDLMG